jgi:hypothetical protein
VSSGQRDTGPLASSHRSSGGFQALLSDAGLWDLVQMKCEARTHCVVRVGSRGRSGYLYFSAGQIVHATLGDLHGEAAALEVLSWSHGSWDPCDRAWPAQVSIKTPWQALLLEAAQRADESSGRLKVTEPSKTPMPADARSDDKTTRPSGDSRASYRPDDFHHAVRLDPQGSVQSGHGRKDELAALAAYACRMGDLVGELMGLGKLRALEARLHEGRCLIFRGHSGAIVAVKPKPEVDLTRLKHQLRL